MTKARILIDAVVVILVVAWLFSGILTKTPIDTPSSIAEAKETLDETIAARDPMSVRGRRSTASEQFELIVLFGRNIDRNESTASALTRSQIVSRHVEIGDKVKKGDVLCELDILDRDAHVEVATDAIDVLEKEYESTLTLIEDDFDQPLNCTRKRVLLSSFWTIPNKCSIEEYFNEPTCPTDQNGLLKHNLSTELALHTGI